MTTQTMPEPIRLWIADLRSGKYKQSTGNLHNDSGYCCLGVACKTALKRGIEVDIYGPQSGVTGKIIGDSLDSQTHVFEWLNLLSHCGEFKGEKFDGFSSLADINDEEIHNFEDIADFIEARWQDLVKEPV